MSALPEPGGYPRSADGLFEWRGDLGVWVPVVAIPPGTATPDRRFEWNGAEWVALTAPPKQASRPRSAADLIGLVAVAVLCAIAAVTVAIPLLVYIALSTLSPSGKG